MKTGISVETIPQHPIIIVTWESAVKPHHITSAFECIQAQLNQASTPQFVMIDFTQNKRTLLKETVSMMLFDLYEHKDVQEWLVVNGGDQWRLVEDVLVKATNKRRVRHFSSKESAQQYVQQQMAFSQ